MLAAAIVQKSFSTNLCLFLLTTEECQKPIDLYITKAKRRFKKNSCCDLSVTVNNILDIYDFVEHFLKKIVE